MEHFLQERLERNGFALHAIMETIVNTFEGLEMRESIGAVSTLVPGMDATLRPDYWLALSFLLSLLLLTVSLNSPSNESQEWISNETIM